MRRNAEAFVKPYRGYNPITGDNCIIKSQSDIDYELEKSMVRIDTSKYQVGESLYTALPHFANDEDVLNSQCQDTIKVYQYCKVTNTPPYKTVFETPSLFIEDILTIDSEFNYLVKVQAEKNKDTNGSTK